MKIRNVMMLIVLAGVFAISPMLLASDAGYSQVIFKVGWYDVGKAALDGQPGVIEVTKGWRSGSEVNTVTFDPEIIEIETMEKTLKKSGTYIGTVSK